MRSEDETTDDPYLSFFGRRRRVPKRITASMSNGRIAWPEKKLLVKRRELESEHT